MICWKNAKDWANKKGIVVIPMSRNNEHILDNYNAVNGFDGIERYILDKEEMEMLDSFEEGYTRFRKHL